MSRYAHSAGLVAWERLTAQPRRTAAPGEADDVILTAIRGAGMVGGTATAPAARAALLPRPAIGCVVAQVECVVGRCPASVVLLLGDREAVGVRLGAFETELGRDLAATGPASDATRSRCGRLASRSGRRCYGAERRGCRRR